MKLRKNLDFDVLMSVVAIVLKGHEHNAFCYNVLRWT